MDTITIKQKKYEIIKFSKSGVLTEVPGILAGAKILTNGFGGNLKIFDARSRNGIEPLLVVECKEGRQENEQILIEPRKYEGGIAVKLEGINAEGIMYHKPFDMVHDIHKILEIKEKELEPQWVQEYKFNLDTATTNKLIDQFPTKPSYLYVKEGTGLITVKFDRPTAPAWTLTHDTKIKIPFDAIYLTWAAQSGKDITFYLSNKDIEEQEGAKRVVVESSTTVLAANATYTGSWYDLLRFGHISYLTSADVASAVNGVRLQESNDGVTPHYEQQQSTTAITIGLVNSFYARLEGIARSRYERIVYVNGAANQSLFSLLCLARPL